MGCGMVDPKVLEKLGIDSEKWTGFAAGLGVERFCMVRLDIRSTISENFIQMILDS